MVETVTDFPQTSDERNVEAARATTEAGAMEEFETNLPDTAPPCFYFIDFFAINQHDPNKDLDQLGTIVKQSPKLLLIASPWERPVTLGRAWCIFELAHAVLGQTKIVLSMPADEKLTFREAV